MFFKTIRYFCLFRFSIFIANITVHFKLFKFYWKYWYFFVILFTLIRRNKFVYSNKPLHKINKSNAKISTHYRIACLYSINICYYIFISYEFLFFFWNRLNSKATILHFQYSHVMWSIEFLLIQILIKIFYACSILYFK